MNKDILLYETGDGGDMIVLNNDLSLSEILYQQVYLSLFGGNLEANTRGNELSSEIRDDWWGNSLIFNENRNKQFNSETERVLDSVALNSSGRIAIINAINNDLSVLKNVSDIEINVFLEKDNRIRITIYLTKPTNKEDKIMQIIWYNSSLEVIIKDII